MYHTQRETCTTHNDLENLQFFLLAISYSVTTLLLAEFIMIMTPFSFIYFMTQKTSSTVAPATCT